MAASVIKYLVQFGPIKSLQQSYKAAVGHKLAKFGLRYDDLYDPLKDEDVAEALNRLPPDVIIARNCRLKRALDLDQKHEYLPKELQEKQTPFNYYLQEVLEEVRAERRERAQLGASAGYTRIYPH